MNLPSSQSIVPSLGKIEKTVFLASLSLITPWMLSAGEIILTDSAVNTTAYDTTGDDITFSIDSGSATQSGAISGTGNLTKTGAGTVVFTGPRTYTGATDVQAGTMHLDGGVAPAIGGAITIDGSNAATLTVSNEARIYSAVGAEMIVGNTGSGNLNVTSGGEVTVQGDARIASGANSNGVVNVDGERSQFYAFESVIVGEGTDSNASFTVSNGGELWMIGDTSYMEIASAAGSSGQVNIFGGWLTAGDTPSGDGIRAGAGSGSIHIDNGWLFAHNTLTISVPITISNKATFDAAGGGSFSQDVVLRGVVSGTGILDQNSGGNLIFAADNTYTGITRVGRGRITIGDGGSTGSIIGDILNFTTVAFNRNDDYTYDGVISGPGSVENNGHIQRFSAAQTYTGSTTVNSGYLVLAPGIDQGLSASTTVGVAEGAYFDFSNSQLTVAGLSGAGSVYSFGGNSGHLTVNDSISSDETFSGTLGSDHPDFAFTKDGEGTLTLSGANNYTGATTVSGGTLVIDGSTGADSQVTVESGGTLGGSGTIGGETTVAGTLTPGNSPGTMNFQNNLTLESTANLVIEVTGDGAGEFDVLNGNGTNTLTLAGILVLAPDMDYTPAVGETIGIFSNWGIITGTFDSITGPDIENGYTWDFSKLYSEGILTVVPEPSSTALLIGVSLGAFVLSRRRRMVTKNEPTTSLQN